MSLCIPVIKQAGVVSLSDSLGLFRVWLVATSSFGCMGDKLETHISGTPVKTFWITALGGGARRNLSPSPSSLSFSLPTSTDHLFMHLCTFSLSFSTYPSIICLSIHPTVIDLSLFLCCCSGTVHLGWPCTAWLMASLSFASPFAMTRLWSLKGIYLSTDLVPCLLSTVSIKAAKVAHGHILHILKSEDHCVPFFTWVPSVGKSYVCLVPTGFTSFKIHLKLLTLTWSFPRLFQEFSLNFFLMIF